MKLKPLALFLALPPSLGYAADIPVLEEILVTATRPENLPLGATRIGDAKLSPMRASTSDSASLLRAIPGVSLYGSGGVSSQPVIHGLADERLRIKVDGMDIYAACPNHMNTPLSYIDPTQVGAIKVWTGITPVSVGGDSIGGAIAVESAAPVFAAPGQGSLFKGEAGAFYRSNGDAWGANLSATHASESASLSYTGALAEADNYKAGGDFKTYDFTGRAGHTLALDEVGSTAYKTRNHTLAAAFKGGDHLVEAKLNYQDLPYQLWPNQRMDMLDNESTKLNLRYAGTFDWGKLDTRIYHEKVDHYMDFGPDKRFWYGPGAPPAGSGGDTALNGSPCSPISGTTAGVGCAAGMPMYTKSKTDGATFKADIALSQTDSLRVGAELHRYQLDDWWPPSGAGMWPNTFWNIRDGERDRAALFGEWEARSSARWMTLAGLRYERVKSDAGTVHGYNLNTFPTSGAGGMGNQTTDAVAFNNAERDKTFNNWDLALQAKYTQSDTVDIEFGFAHKERAPSLYELYTWSTWQMAALMNNFVGDGNGYVGNLDLKPEKANTLSATFAWHARDRDWEFKVTPHYTRVSDYIDAVRCGVGMMGNCPGIPPNPANNSFLRLKYANQSARLYGLDLSGKMPLAKNGFGEWGLNGVVNYTNGRNRDTGDGLYNIMPLNARLALTQRYGAWRNSVEGEFVSRKDDVSAVRNEMETPGYGLVHLRARYEQKSYSVDFGIENLFDRLYYLPLGGAYVGQGTTMTNPPLPNYPQWGTPVPGPGRSVYAGLNVKF